MKLVAIWEFIATREVIYGITQTNDKLYYIRQKNYMKDGEPNFQYLPLSSHIGKTFKSHTKSFIV